MQTEAAIDPQEIIRRQAEDIALLKEEIAWLKKQIFGRKGERLVDIVAHQELQSIHRTAKPESSTSYSGQMEESGDKLRDHNEERQPEPSYEGCLSNLQGTR